VSVQPLTLPPVRWLFVIVLPKRSLTSVISVSMPPPNTHCSPLALNVSVKAPLLSCSSLASKPGGDW
jgi:hypothetical protein